MDASAAEAEAEAIKLIETFGTGARAAVERRGARALDDADLSETWRWMAVQARIVPFAY